MKISINYSETAAALHKKTKPKKDIKTGTAKAFSKELKHINIEIMIIYKVLNTKIIIY